MIRRIDLAMFFLAVFGALWLSIPTSMFIHPVSTNVMGDRVTFTRELLWGREWRARWTSEITVIDSDGFECSSGGWRYANYQPVPGNTVNYQIGDWAMNCVDIGPPFYITTTRQVLLFGWLPLRPSTTRTDVEGQRPVAVIILPVEE